MTVFSAVFIAVLISLTGMMRIPAEAADTEAAENIKPGGGGFAATGQIPDAGYTSKIYDASNGLPSSDANHILCSSDGFIWIGTYSGIIRYDGNSFVTLDTSDGLTGGRCLFEDSRKRIWAGTNDNGVVVLDGGKRTHITSQEGLPSSSVRSFAEDGAGNVFIGTTSGICYADPQLKIHSINERRLSSDRILRLDADLKGRIYGQTQNGYIFQIDGQKVTKLCTGEELGVKKITALKADPHRSGYIYFGTENGGMYYGRFGDPVRGLKYISVSPLDSVKWISYECNRIWAASTDEFGYLDDRYGFRIIGDTGLEGGIEMLTSDYQGNMWFASSAQGVMKLVTNRFTDLFREAGIKADVANAVCYSGEKLYVGTDTGLKIIGKDGQDIQNDLTRSIGDTRVRCIDKGADDDLWIGTFKGRRGLIHVLKDGRTESYTTGNGMPDDNIRCILVMADGTVSAGTNAGIAFIKNGEVTETVGEAEGIDTAVILTLEEAEDNKIYAGTDGGGLYVIDGASAEKPGFDPGVTSDVILRVVKDSERGLYWVITSNSIEYIRDGEITEVTTYPCSYNYDLEFDRNGSMWITCPQGIISVSAEDMINDKVSDHRMYTIENGLSGSPSAYGYCDQDGEGNLYIPVRGGLCRVSMDKPATELIPVKAGISSVYCEDEEIWPDASGSYILPSTKGRVKITPAVLDYSLLNPVVQVYMKGKEDEGITADRSSLQPLEYTNLRYGDYRLNIRVMDAEGKTLLADEGFRFIKKPRLLEMRIFQFLLILVLPAAAVIIVLRVLQSTVIRRQYDEIIKAKEDADRANSAKSRFLANMSHEIRTPVNTIMGMNEIAMREDPAGVPGPYYTSMMNYASDIKNASESLLSLINDLLEMSKIESGTMYPVLQEYDVQDLIRSIVSMIGIRSSEKELAFDVSVDEAIPRRLYGDPGKIKQIVLTLLKNALKYTDAGGFSLNISIQERKDDECRLVFSVRDTGIGVKEEDMDRLFTALERPDEKQGSEVQGTGLSLDISRRFAELMGGSLVCESEYGKGSEFIFTITQKVIDRTPVGVFTERIDSAANGAYVPLFIAPDADILVVDDDPMNLKVIKGLLKGTKVFVSTASGGEECLDKIKDTGFNVVLLDHNMPGMDGAETVAEIRKDQPELPVYAMTDDDTSGEEFYRAEGFNGFLTRPIDGRALERAIMKHLPEKMMEKPDDGGNE